VYTSIQRVNKIILFAISENYLKKDPFHLYKNKKHKTVIIYLTDEELKKLEKYNFGQKRLQQVKDLFIFCCYTGLAYAQMSSLTTKNIEIGFYGNEWILMVCTKTNRNISMPFLSKAKEILEKYHSNLFVIQTKRTHPNAWITFAITVLLFREVLIEIVSDFLQWEFEQQS
jgi:integrase/recombinase XerD